MKILPRILSILIVSFFAIFILEGFSPPFGWQNSLSHLILTIIVLAITILSWKKPHIGGWIFITLGLSFLLLTNNHQIVPLILFCVIPFLTGILFIIEK